MVGAGKLAAAVGSDKFPKDALEGFVVFAKDCLKQDTNKMELRETAMTFFYELSCLLGEGIAPIFPEVMPEILKTCTRDDDFEDVKKEGNGPDGAKGFSLDSDSDDGDALGLEVDTACLDEKAAAVNAIGYMFLNAPLTCKTMMPEILEALEKL